MDIMNFITRPQNTIEMIVYILIIIILSTVLLRLITFTMRHLHKKEDLDMTKPYIIRDILQYTIYFIAVILILDIIGIDISGILLSVGIMSIIVGFAAKDIISNFMSGMFVVTDKSIKVGDEIVVDNIKGNVINMTFRKITLQTPDNVIVTIPNSILSTKVYTNNTNELPVVLTLIIYLKLNIDIEEYEKRIIEECEKLDFVNNKHNNKMNIIEFDDIGIKTKLYIGIKKHEDIERNRLIIGNIARKILNEMDK